MVTMASNGPYLMSNLTTSVTSATANNCIYGGIGYDWGTANNCLTQVVTASATIFAQVQEQTVQWVTWNYPYIVNQMDQMVLTPEAQAALEKQRLEEEEVRRKARVRARELLRQTLTDMQREQLEKEEAFELQVGDRLYRIRLGRKVERLNVATKKVEKLFCIHPDFEHRLPEEDIAISQKLLLETDEGKFLSVANEWAA